MPDTWLPFLVAGGRRWWGEKGGASRFCFMRGFKNDDFFQSTRPLNIAWRSKGKKGKSSPARECKGRGRVRME